MKKVAVITLGGEEFGLDILRVVEILRAQRTFHLPQLPSFFSGVVNIRGEVVPLIDLRLRFGLPPSPRKERVVVVMFGGEKVGLFVDAVQEILSISPEEESAPPSMVKGLRAEYLTGLIRKGDRIIILLNIDALLTAEEKLQLEDLGKLPSGAGHGGDTQTTQQ